MTDLISNHVDVSLNEYVTKYSFNRNFQKLIENDVNLSSEVQKHINYNTVNSYIDGKTYYKGECIFYKTSSKSMNIYTLSCIADVTINAPSCIYDSIGNLIVVSNDKWEIIGIYNSELSSNPIDFANEYVQNSQKLLSTHANDEYLSAHPTKKLGINDSSILFKSLENIDENRKVFFYPNHLQTLQPDNTIVNGYMRKWDCGLLEYDVIFKVGCFGDKTEDNIDILSANCLKPTRGIQNQFYFKSEEDYNIFNQQSDKYVVANNVKQMNLNTSLNAYHGIIKFPQEFKDLNYMMFSTDAKSIETEAISLVDEKQSYPAYDSRLIVKNLTIKSHKDGEDYQTPLEIPYWIETIDDYALAYIEETNANLPKILFGNKVNSRLIDVGEGAFEGTAFKHIEFPRSVRCIGMNALAECKNLASVDIWVNVDREKQVILDYNVFEGDDNLSTINLHYFDEKANSTLFGSSREESLTRISAYTNIEDLSTKLIDPNLQKIYGLNQNVSVIVDDSQIRKLSYSNNAFNNAMLKKNNNIEYTTIDVQTLIKNTNESPEEKKNNFGVLSQQNEFDQKKVNLTCINNDKEKQISLPINDDNSIVLDNLSDYFDKIQLDVSGLHFNFASISNLSCNTLEIINLSRSNDIHSYANSKELYMKGFAPSAFIQCKINTINFTGDVTEKEVKMVTQFKKEDNILNLNDSCIIISPNTKYLVTNNNLIDFPHSRYLRIDDSCALISCMGAIDSKIDIPYGTKTIKSFAFANTSISSISIPSSMLSIEDFAFNQMNQIAKIDFDPNVKLQYIGNCIFDNACSNIVDFKMY